MGFGPSRAVKAARFVVLGLFALAAWAVAQGTAHALPPYPSPPPDFSHPGTYHDTSWGANDPVYSPIGGQRDRPMLVVLPRFSDVANTPGADEAWAQRRFFGGFPSAADWFNQMSGGDLILTPAQESSGTANNGVVIVNAGTFSSFEGLSDTARSRRVLELADSAVNFATFDANSDGTVDDLELAVVSVRTGNPVADDPATPANETNTDDCGATRNASAGTFDGKTLTNHAVGLDTTLTNLMTEVHELGHQTTHMRDLYGFGVGSWAISGPTCGPPDSLLFGPNGWERVHFGWGTPTVVVQDGYYDVPDTAAAGRFFILYDPSKGTDDYFVVENRQATPNSYEQSVHDSGLAIWRSDDAVWESGSDSTRPIEIMRPDGTTTGGCGSGGCYGGSNIDAWNPCDTGTPQRTMSRTWRDGTASRVAVRAIGCSGGTIRAYFDVRGPGVMVDAATATAGTRTIDVVPDEANPLSFTVMNTGETTDAFAFTLQGLPAGWTASTSTQTLGAGAGSTANITVTPPADAPTSTFDVEAVGRSTTASGITSTSPLKLHVVLHRTQLDYTGDTSQPWGEGAGFAATVKDADAGLAPVAGAPVTFRLTGAGGTQEVTATSDATGVAQANPALTVAPGTYTLTTSVPRFGKHAAASVTTSYTVERRPTAVVYNGSSTAQYSDPAAVSGVLTDAISGAPLTGRTVGFTLGTQSASAVTDGTGTAATQIVLDQAAATTSVETAFAGDDLYLPSSDSDPFTITRENLTFAYTGDTLVALGNTPVLSVQATQEDDGYPGDVSLGAVRFDLAPTLTSTPYDYTTGLTAAGAGTTPATGLPVDLWTVTPSVPAGNGYWQGTGPAAELVVFDPSARIEGGFGDDTAGDRVQLELNGRYDAALRPVGELQLRSGQGRFKATGYDWIVRVDDRAILQADGLLDGAPATLRLRLTDGGEPGVGADWFSARLGAYDSGQVGLTGGNLQIR